MMRMMKTTMSMPTVRVAPRPRIFGGRRQCNPGCHGADLMLRSSERVVKASYHHTTQINFCSGGPTLGASKISPAREFHSAIRSSHTALPGRGPGACFPRCMANTADTCRTISSANSTATSSSSSSSTPRLKVNRHVTTTSAPASGSYPAEPGAPPPGVYFQGAALCGEHRTGTTSSCGAEGTGSSTTSPPAFTFPTAGGLFDEQESAGAAPAVGLAKAFIYHGGKTSGADSNALNLNGILDHFAAGNDPVFTVQNSFLGQLRKRSSSQYLWLSLHSAGGNGTYWAYFLRTGGVVIWAPPTTIAQTTTGGGAQVQDEQATNNFDAVKHLIEVGRDHLFCETTGHSNAFEQTVSAGFGEGPGHIMTPGSSSTRNYTASWSALRTNATNSSTSAISSATGNKKTHERKHSEGVRKLLSWLPTKKSENSLLAKANQTIVSNVKLDYEQQIEWSESLSFSTVPGPGAGGSSLATSTTSKTGCTSGEKHTDMNQKKRDVLEQSKDHLGNIKAGSAAFGTAAPGAFSSSTLRLHGNSYSASNMKSSFHLHDSHIRLQRDASNLPTLCLATSLAMDFAVRVNVEEQLLKEFLELVDSELTKFRTELQKTLDYVIFVKRISSLQKRIFNLEVSCQRLLYAKLHPLRENADVVDLLWESGEAEKIYEDVCQQTFDLPSRINKLRHELDYMVGLSRTHNEHVRHGHSSQLECLIIYLIALEILLFVGDHWNHIFCAKPSKANTSDRAVE
ncbi:unnamed protein product [Amoebophrya sp. A120]|nr:unnamed protein product [Amoebophrya sp. A120]|eukprot:GSA120T00004386001.1